MSAQQQKMGFAFWAAIVIVSALVMYPLSFGPVCWITSRANCSHEILTTIYQPVHWVWGLNAENRVGHAIRWYVQLGAADGWHWIGETRRDSDGNEYWDERWRYISP